MEFRTSVEIFWSESSIYILLYAAFAVLVCGILSALEYHAQTTAVASSRVVAKAVVLVSAAVVCFTLSLYIAGWHANALGGELLALIVLSVAWVLLMYFLNRYAIDAVGLAFDKVKRYTLLPALMLVAPFPLFGLFIYLLGSAWKN